MLDLTKRKRSAPCVRGTLIEHALERAAAMPDAPVFLGEARPIDHAFLLEQAESLAAGLQEQGLRAGDVIAFQLPNWFEAAVVNLAACRLGLVCAPLLPFYREAELAFMLDAAGCRAVFFPAAFRGFDFGAMYQRLGPTLSCRPLLVALRGEAEGATRYEDLVAAGRNRTPAWPRVKSDSVKLLLYTSGTTGRAKAVLHSHESLARAVLMSVEHWNIRPGDVVLMPSPVTHATGYANALELPFLHGTRTVLMDRWDAARAIELIEQHDVAATVGATPFLRELTAAAGQANSRLPSLRVFACGGAAVPPEVIADANRIFAKRPAFRVYGSSEAPYVALGRPSQDSQDDGVLAATTDGEVIDYEVRIVDERGCDVAAGGEGEILVRGAALFRGYGNPADNRDCFTTDGFFRTGDIGAIVRGSWLTITGRKKDLIIRGGENIGAKEIEDVLHGHPSIAEAAVVAMPHERLGEAICAFVIARADVEPTLHDLTVHLQARCLARHKYPERLIVVKELPRTASGKIRKDILRAVAADEAGMRAGVGYEAR